MAHDIAWFKKWEAEKAAKEAAKKKAENPDYQLNPEEEKKRVSITKDDNVDGSGYFNFHKNTNYIDNPHYFLSEELLIPYASSTDTQRANMFANHINQFVHLKEPEFPKVFTNFEDQVGEYSVAYKKAERDFVIIDKIVKNAFNYDLIIQYKGNNVYDIIHYQKARNITEDYGYAVNDCLANKEVGDSVSEGSFLYKSDNYDDDGNYMYGRNLKAVYVPFHNRTYEDGVVISESAAKKFTSYKVEKTMVSINGNDLLVNIYGDEHNYKSFPKVGDHVDSGVLIASRRRDKRSILYDLQSKKIMTYDPDNDDVTYTSGGTITDIDVFSNMPLVELRKKAGLFNNEILEIVENNQRYWNDLANALEKIIPCREMTEEELKAERAEYGINIKHPIPKDENPNKYTDEISYMWKQSHENCDERIKWRYNGKSFDNFKVQFTILKENPLTTGCKLTGRYGNKGIVSWICPDDQMPVTEDGVRADICLNPLGIINRLNPSQIKEQYLNFMADHVVKLMKETDDYDRKESLFLDFLKEINKKEYDYFSVELLMMNRQQKYDFIDGVERDGIYIHEPPFFGNTSMEQFKRIFREHPEWCTEYRFVGIEKPMTMGDIYFMRLKHEPANKSSMRSAASLNVKNLPAKSALKKEKKVPFSTTPIRLGEMETTNLLISKRGDTVEKLLKTYSTNEKLREQTISQLLNPGTKPDGHLVNTLDMDIDADLKNNPSISREILEKYLNLLGISIVDDNGDGSGN